MKYNVPVLIISAFIVGIVVVLLVWYVDSKTTEKHKFKQKVEFEQEVERKENTRKIQLKQEVERKEKTRKIQLKQEVERKEHNRKVLLKREVQRIEIKDKNTRRLKVNNMIDEFETAYFKITDKEDYTYENAVVLKNIYNKYKLSHKDFDYAFETVIETVKNYDGMVRWEEFYEMRVAFEKSAKDQF